MNRNGDTADKSLRMESNKRGFLSSKGKLSLAETRNPPTDDTLLVSGPTWSGPVHQVH